MIHEENKPVNINENVYEKPNIDEREPIKFEKIIIHVDDVIVFDNGVYDLNTSTFNSE